MLSKQEAYSAARSPRATSMKHACARRRPGSSVVSSAPSLNMLRAAAAAAACTAVTCVHRHPYTRSCTFVPPSSNAGQLAHRTAAQGAPVEQRPVGGRGGKSYACGYLSHDRVQTNTPTNYIAEAMVHPSRRSTWYDCPAPGRLSHPGMRNLLTGPLPAYIYAGAPSPSMLKHLQRRRSHQPPAGTASPTLDTIDTMTCDARINCQSAL